MEQVNYKNTHFKTGMENGKQTKCIPNSLYENCYSHQWKAKMLARRKVTVVINIVWITLCLQVRVFFSVMVHHANVAPQSSGMEMHHSSTDQYH